MAHEHLTPIQGTLMAWHQTEDIQSVHHDGTDHLYVDGIEVPLADYHHVPTQQVINYCSATPRQRKDLRKVWADLANFGA